MTTFIITPEDDGTFMVSPQSEQDNGRYLIQTSTKEEAETIRYQLGNGELTSPLQNGSFDIQRHSGETPIYTLR